MTLSSKIALSVEGDLTTALDLTTVSAPVRVAKVARMLSGTGAGQADKMWSDTRTLAASATEDLDLAGVLTDPFGALITFVKVKGIYVAAAPGNTNNVLVGGVTNGWAALLSPAATGILTVRPGAWFAACAGIADATGYAVTAATADLLHVANSAGGTSVTYDIVVIGTSA